MAPHRGSADSEFAAPRDYGFRTAFLHLKGDWAEACKSLGLSAWSSYNCPCQYCRLGLNEVHSLYDDLSSPDGVPWPMRDDDDYFQSVATCQIDVLLSSGAELKELNDALKWPNAGKHHNKKGKPGIGGRGIIGG